MFRLNFQAEGIFNALERASVLLDDLTPVHQDIGEYMIEATRDRFRRGEAPDGTKWQPKSAVTLARYLAAGDGARPHPLIGPSGRLSTEIAMTATRTSTEVGSALEYSAVMQHGAAKGAFGRDSRKHSIPWGAIPPRVWLGLSDDDERNIIDIVDEHLVKAL